MNNRYIHTICCLGLVVLFFTGCSTTRLIPDDEVLYTGVKKMKFTSADSLKIPGYVISAAKEPLSVAPNNPLYSPYIRTPFPIGLWVYNNFKPKKNKGFKHWLYEKLAKDPILISDVQPDVRLNVVDDILGNYGYFGAKSHYELLYSKRNKKKARINYFVEIPAPYHYLEISYPKVTNRVTAVIDSLSTSSLLRVGAQYNADTLAAERNRIASVLRNKGYYFFRPEYVEYLADTTLKPQKVALRMQLKQGVPLEALRAYQVGKIQVYLESSTGQGVVDSLYYKGLEVIYQKPLKIRPSVLARNIDLHTGRVYTVASQNRTQTNLNKLGIFRFINLNVTPIDSLRQSDTLNVYLNGAFDVPLESEFEIDVSSKSNNFIGPGITFGINHKNIFKGGENLSVKLNGAYEWQTGSKQSSGNSSLLNSYELGVNSSLSFPRLLAPRFLARRTNYPARTTFQIGVDLLNRPRYFRMISFSGSANYDFQTRSYMYHTFIPFKLVYNKLLNTSESFNQTISENPAIALSFRDQFIPTLGYVLTFDRSYGPTQRRRFFWQNTLTEAGNILSGVISLTGKKGEKKLFGNEFSQFIKGISEFKYYYRLWGDNWLASRFLVGAGYAYGNSTVMPYSEQFYIGGANSIRAFTIRSLGPGSYRPPQGDVNGYFDQTGDFKLEANVEFRFKILGKLNGAVFLDAGNIWLLKNDPKRPGGELTWKGFGKDIALGTGFGLRFDISYLVLRADLGIGIHTPYKNPDKPGYYNIKNFKDGLGFHLAIGYPF